MNFEKGQERLKRLLDQERNTLKEVRRRGNETFKYSPFIIIDADMGDPRYINRNCTLLSLWMWCTRKKDDSWATLGR